jgi:predicted amidohydrolase
MSDTGYAMSAIREHASRWNEGAVPELRAMARELSIGIICGVSEREHECIFNAQVVIDPAGEIIGKYRKTHLFRPAPVEEHTACTAGAEMVALPIGDLRFGLGICYDLRFPEFHRALAIEHDADVFALSSAWPFPRVEHLRALATARAIENQSYVVLSNRVGTDLGVAFCGTSCIIDPYGVVIAAASSDREELIVADVSADIVRSVRQAMPVLDHRRPEVYSPR